MLIGALLLGAPFAGGREAGGVSWLEGRPSHESRFSVLLPEIVGFPAPVRAAFAAGIALGTGNWAWTERVRNADGETLARWDPSQPPGRRIVLLEVDGQRPTAGEVEAFLKRARSELVEGVKERPVLSRRMQRVVRAMRFSELRREAGRIDYRLEFAEPDLRGLGWVDRAFVRVLTGVEGSVVVDTQLPGFVAVDLSLAGPVRLLPGVKIERLDVRIDSVPVPEARTWLPRNLLVEIRGGAWLFGRIARSLEMAFSDFTNVGLAPLPLEEVLAGAGAGGQGGE